MYNNYVCALTCAAIYLCRADSCVEGGESIMLDTLPVVEQLKQEHPHHFHTLTRVPATFQKMHFDRYRRKYIEVVEVSL